MSSTGPPQLSRSYRWLCYQCRRHRHPLVSSPPVDQRRLQRHISTSRSNRNLAELEKASLDDKSVPPQPAAYQVAAAPPLNFDSVPVSRRTPARIIPASPSYFTASPQFNDHILLLRSLLHEYGNLPIVPSNEVPRAAWLKLPAYRTSIGEPVTSSKYSKVLQLLARLNKIHPKLRTSKLESVMDIFRRPDIVQKNRPPPQTLDEQGRSSGIGRRKESRAKVFLVEGTGEVLVNSKNIVQAFPRLHDRESALWALKVTGRMDRYNVFALTHGGGLTGQAESITLGLARALMVHEPALKPVLRKGESPHRSPFFLHYRIVADHILFVFTAGCVSFDARRVERKKPGRLKARKRPTWTKR